MAERNPLLILRLEGVLQSWGEMSKWDFRDSSTLPTKSGIVGLLGCAMGLEYGSSVLTELAQSFSMAVRADRAGSKFVDFQTIHGSPLLNAAGKSRSGGNTVISHREYIQDACFTVFIDTEDAWMERIVNALNDPKWCVYLGRKNCIPSRPVLECVSRDYNSLLDAVMHFPVCSNAQYPIVYEFEDANQTGAAVFRPDDLIGDLRQFGMRRVWRGTIEEEFDNNVPD